jgi:hypothetical protein
MTAQFDDLFLYGEVEYSVSGISGGEVFDPFALGLNPVGSCTACWRGYQALFTITDSRLVLDTIHVNLFEEGEGYVRHEGPAINGIWPKGPVGKNDLFNNHYMGINFPLEYTGGLLLANGFIEDLYVHMGFHPAWKYENVIELIFEKGALKAEFDRTKLMARVRKTVLKSGRKKGRGQSLSREEIARFVDQAFDRTYTI